jgi:hypothetical protein
MPRADQAGCQVKTLIAIILVALVAGCSSTQKIVEKPVMVERQKLLVPEVQPVEQINLEWTVLTKENFEARVREIEEQGGQFVVFALTPQGYQNLSINVAELRRYIIQQRSILVAYKEYYDKPPEAPKPPLAEDKPFWKLW